MYLLLIPRHNFSLSTMGGYPQIGGLHLTAAGARDNMKRNRDEYNHGHRKKSLTSTPSISTLSSNATASVLKTITSAAELDANKRSSTASYRLHAAKYLKMDSMLKELMFPLHRFKGFFGFMQSSGQGLAVAVPATSDTVAKLAPRSAFRSVSFFKLRHTAPRYIADYDGQPDPTVAPTDADQAKVLNASRVVIGDTTFSDDGDSQTIRSYFRRFNNRPVLTSGAGAGGSPDNDVQGVQTMSSSPGFYKQLAMDYNCADIEQVSLNQSPFTQYVQPSTTQGGGGIEGSLNVNQGPQNYTGTNAYAVSTNNTWKDSTVRIADGKLSMDIQNGSRVPTVVEIVIHSMKRGGPATTKQMRTQDIYEALWKAGNWEHAYKSNFDTPTTGNAGSPQGGWNMFWDPKTPFLKLKGSGKKFMENIASEVHRSIHYLAPGESKTVSIALGSLYYKVGHRSGSYASSDTTTTGVIDVRTDGAGTLAVAVGAFGIDCLETAFGDGFVANLVAAGGSGTAQEGAGFWIGKRPAPSQIVVSGTYEEAWYPTYLSQPGRFIGSVNAAQPSILNGEQAVPLGTIAPTQVNAIDDSSYFAPVGGGKAPPADQSTLNPP